MTMLIPMRGKLITFIAVSILMLAGCSSNSEMVDHEDVSVQVDASTVVEDESTALRIAKTLRSDIDTWIEFVEAEDAIGQDVYLDGALYTCNLLAEHVEGEDDASVLEICAKLSSGAFFTDSERLEEIVELTAVLVEKLSA